MGVSGVAEQGVGAFASRQYDRLYCFLAGGNDAGQLSAMLLAADEVFDCAPLRGPADSGYYNCEDQGHTVHVPVSKPKGPESERIPICEFAYDREKNAYRCPQGRN